jgi:hypothetical protein
MVVLRRVVHCEVSDSPFGPILHMSTVSMRDRNAAVAPLGHRLGDADGSRFHDLPPTDG